MILLAVLLGKQGIGLATNVGLDPMSGLLSSTISYFGVPDTDCELVFLNSL